MDKDWDQAEVQRHIDEGIEESLNLDHKAAGALDKAPSNKKEIAKDVSAMANSAGGIIIYGVREHQEEEKRYLPEKLDPIDRTQFSKEWLEHVVADNIWPRIEGLVIHPVNLETGLSDVIYVVDIPQSTTAHQVTVDKDYRYYRRHNFESVRMHDYEIRDVMNRAIQAEQAKFGSVTVSKFRDHREDPDRIEVIYHSDKVLFPEGEVDIGTEIQCI
jgi:predicted HTH transcriptional regulator